MKRRWIVVIVICAVFLILALAVLVAGVFMVVGKKGVPKFGNNIALIRVEGAITSGRGGSSVFGDAVAGSERIVNELEDARKDSSINAIVIRINSPGGSAAGSQEVYRQIRRVRMSKKVVVSMGDVAASGGYYIASAADRIFADPATITGSIGVIMETTDLRGLFDKLGIQMNTIKSGKHKDMGSPARPLTPEEKKILQGVIDDVFSQFVADVRTGRKLPVRYVRQLADGRVFTGSQAKEKKLVDELGGLEDAIRYTARAARIADDYEVVEYGREGLFNYLFGQAESRIGRGDAGAVMEAARMLLLRDDRLVR